MSQVACEPLPPEIDAFVRTALGAAKVTATLLAGGANNQVYKINAGGQAYVLKKYFRGTGDKRDRYAAENSFYMALWPLGVHCIPEPLAWDARLQLGLFSFIAGRNYDPDEIRESILAQAADFIVQINEVIRGQKRLNFPTASEACFSLAEHMELLHRRIKRLQKIEVQSKTDTEARAFVEQELRAAWHKVQGAVESRWAAHGQDPLSVLPIDQRCLSPSDFGFHNVLVTPAGRLFFHDFEYAGWDDPAKLCCDFFCQPKIPAPARLRTGFVRRLATALPEIAADLEFRVESLLPVYQLKWCCIMLNEFVSDDLARRKFSLAQVDIEERKRRQLEISRSALNQINIS